MTLPVRQIPLSDAEVLAIAEKIDQNETGGVEDRLVWWNAHEAFASVGVGHFLWMPSGYTGPYESTFIEFLHYAASQGVVLPNFLATYPPCPWKSREDFLAHKQDPVLLSLQHFLTTHREIQAHFMADRLIGVLTLLKTKTSFPLREHMALQIYRLTGTVQGFYALEDYVNFKGSGLTARGKIGENGWGLAQVLMNMQGVLGGESALSDFKKAATTVLLHRIAEHPDDARWENGWMKRIETY
jgi:hypothetical protein